MAKPQHGAAAEVLSPLDSIAAARKIWLTATSSDELEYVESLYMEALTSKPQEDTSDEPSKKRQKLYSKLSREDYRQASEKLALLLCQSGRYKKAKKPLSKLGFICRLAEKVLDYPTTNDPTSPKSIASKTAPCQIIDGFLSQTEMQKLISIFASPSANYWTSHKYLIEPPSPYFSYVIPLDEKRNGYEIDTDKFGFIGSLIKKLISCPILVKKFTSISETKYVEMWAHNRPHASGHQMHFDSDDEGRDGVRNPIISTILYITVNDDGSDDSTYSCTAGGPSLVTNQTLESDHLATRGWLSHPKPKRLVAFDGRYLHGVIPGKGVSAKDSRRVTLMLAFWKDLKVRRGLGPGSARPFPINGSNKMIPEWAKTLTEPSETSDSGASENPYKNCTETAPLGLDVVYETLDGKPWKKSKGMPSYDEVFQGF
jgi:hypothetical protein